MSGRERVKRKLEVKRGNKHNRKRRREEREKSIVLIISKIQ